MARTLNAEEQVKAKLGYMWDYVPQEEKDRLRNEIEASMKQELSSLANNNYDFCRREESKNRTIGQARVFSGFLKF